MNPFLQDYNADDSDEILIKKSLEGDQNALEELLKMHQPFIYNIAWKMVRDPNDAEDLTQEAMLKIVTSLSNFSFKSTFRTWAYRIVVNHFLNHKKKKDETFFNSFETMENILDSVEDRPMTQLEQEESKEVIREMNLMCMSGMLLCLNREQRLIYIIGELLGGDHTIGSEIMSIKKDNFRAKLKKARKDLYHFMNHKCGLVNKDNPCRCHKKVTVAIENESISAKELLFNKEQYSTFVSQLSEDSNSMLDEFEEKYAQLHQESSFRKDFDKKTFIHRLLVDDKWKQSFNLE